MSSPSIIVEPLNPVPDPWQVFQNLASHHVPHLLFLDSAQKHETRGRYSYVTAAPTTWIANTCWEFQRDGEIELLKELLDDHWCESLPGLPPFQGGLAGLFGYRLGQIFDQLPFMPPGDLQEDIAVGIYHWVLAWDHLQNAAWLISHPGGPDVKAICEWMQPGTKRDDRWDRKSVTNTLKGYPIQGKTVSNFSPDEFKEQSISSMPVTAFRSIWRRL